MCIIQKFTSFDLKVNLNINTKEKYLFPSSQDEEVLNKSLLFEEDEISKIQSLEKSLFYENYMKSINSRHYTSK